MAQYFSKSSAIFFAQVFKRFFRSLLRMKSVNSGVQPRFRSNPIELVICGAVFLIFLNSAYELFYQRSLFAAWQPRGLQRTLSSEKVDGPTVKSIDYNCNDTSTQSTLANGVRFKGPFCSEGLTSTPTAQAGALQLLTSTIKNKTNQFEATVFSDQVAHEFSTDYIPLKVGENLIHFEFSYLNGTLFSKDLKIIRRE